MKTKILLTILATAGACTFSSCEIVGTTPLTATVSLWGEGWETSVDVATITTRSSSKNPISWEDGVDIVVESSKNPIE